jgi:hypothetical protein
MPQKLNPNLWSQAQSQMAAELWQQHFVDLYGDDLKLAPRNAADRVFRRIGIEIGREMTSVYYRFQNSGPTFGAMQTSPRKLSAEVIAARLAREDAENRRDLTAAFFKDPPPGYSALDRRKSA